MKKPYTNIETERLQDLYSYNILNTDPETDYSDLAELASLICECPIAAITFVDKERQWFKAKVGDPIRETRRDISFCSHTILEDETLIVTDAALDIRFKKNPDVTGGLKIRFYAGYPIYSVKGNKLGSVCVVDKKPRTLTKAQIKILKLISKQVTHLLELRLRNNLLKDNSQKLLQNTEKIVESFFDNSMIAKCIYEIDTLKILQANDAAIKKYGYIKEEFLKMSIVDLRIKKEKQNIHQLLQKINDDSAVSTFETVHQTKNGKEINVEVSVNETLFLGKVARLATIVDITEKKNIENKLSFERKHNSKKIEKAQHDTEKNTKDNIGRELHDNINQILACSKLYLDIASKNEELRDVMIDRSKEYINDAISAIRRLSSSLVSDNVDDFKLTESIQALAESISFANALHLDLSIGNEVENLPNDIKINLFRIIQEQINNILKYAQASFASISIIIRNKIQLLIKDNGVGCNSPEQGNGIGLTNIKNRAEFYNGTAKISSNPNKGFEVLVELPLVEPIKVAC